MCKSGSRKTSVRLNYRYGFKLYGRPQLVVSSSAGNPTIFSSSSLLLDLTPKVTTSIVLNYFFTSEEITFSFSGKSVISMVSFVVGKWVLDHQ